MNRDRYVYILTTSEEKAKQYNCHTLNKFGHLSSLIAHFKKLGLIKQETTYAYIYSSIKVYGAFQSGEVKIYRELYYKNL